MSADDLVKEILAETARRKVIWEQMQTVARQALAAVDKEARKRGVQDVAWVNQCAHLIFRPRAEGSAVLLKLFPDGQLQYTSGPNLTYNGLPNFDDQNPERFLSEAIWQLMHILNKHLGQ